MDDKSKVERVNRERINPAEAYEMEYWSKKFGVTYEQLKSAIRAVGNSIAAIEKRLEINKIKI
jgi:hypothetical protein